MPEKKKKILIIDDDEVIRKVIKLNLELTGEYEVMTSPDGKKGLESARKNRPHLILLDVSMPDVNGFEVLKELKENDETMSIPVAMLSGLAQEGLKLKAVQLYSEEYIAKPIDARELRKRVSEIIKKYNIA